MTDEQAAEIKALKGSEKSRHIASIYGVNKTTILNIWNDVYYRNA